MYRHDSDSKIRGMIWSDLVLFGILTTNVANHVHAGIIHLTPILYLIYITYIFYII